MPSDYEDEIGATVSGWSEELNGAGEEDYQVAEKEWEEEGGKHSALCHYAQAASAGHEGAQARLDEISPLQWAELIVDLTRENDGLRERQATLNFSLGPLHQSVDALTEKLAGLEQQASGTKGRKGSGSADSKLAGKVAALEAQVKELRGEIGKRTRLEALLDAFSGELKNQGAEIKALQRLGVQETATQGRRGRRRADSTGSIAVWTPAVGGGDVPPSPRPDRQAPAPIRTYVNVAGDEVSAARRSRVPSVEAQEARHKQLKAAREEERRKAAEEKADKKRRRQEAKKARKGQGEGAAAQGHHESPAPRRAAPSPGRKPPAEGRRAVGDVGGETPAPSRAAPAAPAPKKKGGPGTRWGLGAKAHGGKKGKGAGAGAEQREQGHPEGPREGEVPEGTAAGLIARWGGGAAK